MQAQRGGHGNAGFLSLDEDLRAELSLSDEQVEQLEVLREEMCTRMGDLQEGSEAGEGDRRAARRGLHREMKASLAEILTEEQLAQLRSMRDERREAHRDAMENVDHKAMRAALREYKQTTVRPVMLEQRSELDQYLTEDDQTLLANIRSLVQIEREEAKANRQERRQQRQERMDNSERGRRGQRGDMQQERGERSRRAHAGRGAKGPQWMDEYPEEWAALQELAQRYDSEITGLLDDLEDEREQWRTEEETIRNNYLPADMQRPERNGEGLCPNLREDMRSAREERHKIHFLLMDPNGGFNMDEEAASEEPSLKASTYPNPAVNQTTLSFTQEQEAAVRIELRDESGGVVQTISRETYSPGEHKLDIDLSNLQNGTYYLTLTGVGGTESVKLVVVK